MTHPLVAALWTVIGTIDRLAGLDVPTTATWVYSGEPLTTKTVGRLAKTVSAHAQMLYVTETLNLESHLKALSAPMAAIPSVAHGTFHWTFSGGKTGGSTKLKVMLQGIVVSQGKVGTLRKDVANLADFLATLPPHGGTIFTVAGTRFMAADAPTALALWAALHQKGAPTQAGTRDLLTGPRRPEILRIVDLDDDLVAQTLHHL